MADTQKTHGFTRARQDRLVTHSVELDDGRVVSLFVNRDTNLITLDIVDADEKGDSELLRWNA